MIINIHKHIYAEDDVHRWRDEELVEGERVVTVVFGDWNKCEEVAAAYPDDVIPFGIISDDDWSTIPSYGDRPELVDEFHDRGFRGLKMTRMRRAYDDPAYYPIYEKAAHYGMPILFHTGHVGWAPERGVISIRKMDAACLDGIARAFPELDLIGAHLGAPLMDQACGITLKHKRIFFDLSGGTIRKLSYARWKTLLTTSAEENLRSLDDKLDLDIVGKFVFGTDNADIHSCLEFHRNLFNAFDVPEEIRQKILCRNAARILKMA